MLESRRQAPNDQVNCFFCRVRNPGKTNLLSSKDPLLDHEQEEISHAMPEFLSNQNQGERPNFAALQQGGRFKEFIKSTKPTGQDDVGARVLYQHHLTNEEVMKFDGVVDIRIGFLLVRKNDVEPIRESTSFVGATVRGLHGTRTSSGDHCKAGFGEPATYLAPQFIVRMTSSKSGRTEYRDGRSEISRSEEHTSELQSRRDL